MNQTMKIQMDIKNNAQDLQNYVIDLNNWEKEMKKKEMELTKNKIPQPDIPPPRNKIKRNKTENEKVSIKSKAKKISGYDYSAWDKYDADKACSELDEDEIFIQNNSNMEGKSSTGDVEDVKAGSSEEENDDDEDKEKKLSLIDQAVFQKELGNQYVKKEQWNDAIKCYTQAIQLDHKNPIYYSNRSLCFLKLKNFRASEVDATTALQLDNSYVKAYQRRGYARLALGQLAEAKADFEEVLKIEPKNSLMSLEVNKINEKLKKLNDTQPKTTFNHKNLFKNEIQKDKIEAPSEFKVQLPEEKVEKKVINSNSKPLPNSINKVKKITNNVDLESVEKKQIKSDDGQKVNENLFKFKELPPHCKVIHPVQIPPHKRSKKPLKKIPIVEVFSEPDLDGNGDEFDSFHSGEQKSICPTINQEIKTEEKLKITCPNEEKYTLEEPKMFVQFHNNWKIIRKYPEDACKYLNKIADKLPQVFGNSLESDIFSDLLNFLAFKCPRNELSVIYSLLLNLSKVKRFTSMTLFMSKEDKESVNKCISELKEVKSEKEISELISLYEL